MNNKKNYVLLRMGKISLAYPLNTRDQPTAGDSKTKRSTAHALTNNKRIFLNHTKHFRASRTRSSS